MTLAMRIPGPLRALAAVLALGLAAAAARADPPPPLPADGVPPPLPMARAGQGQDDTAAADEAERLALAKRYLTQVGFDRAYGRLVDKVLFIGRRVRGSDAGEGVPELPGPVSGQIEAATRAALASRAPRVRALVAQALAQDLTLGQLSERLATGGPSTALADAAVGRALKEALEDLVPQLRDDIIRRVCSGENACPP